MRQNQPTLLAEKPSQAKSYADAFSIESRSKHAIVLKPHELFPNGLTITWAIGHLLGLKEPQAYNEKYSKWHMDNLPIFPEKFQYEVSKDKITHFKEVKRLLQEGSEVWIGTDLDREGSLIAMELVKYIGIENKTIKRLWINSLEKEEVRRGIKNLRDANQTYNFFLEAQARQKADWLVGMNLSPLFSLLLQQQGYKGSLSIGRVQSPTVYMIYERQKEIENFQSQTFYEIEGTFKAENGAYKGKANVKEYEKQKAQNVLSNHNIQDQQQAKVQSIETKEKRQKSPKLHSLSSLQSKANKQWKYSPKKVLDIVQGLYDKKILSYPRTDCHYITDHEFKYLVDNLEKYQALMNVSFEANTTAKKGYVDSNKVEEHYAIIPTRTLPKIDNLTSEEKNIYFEVLATMLAMFHDDYVYDETIVLTNVNDLLFQTKGKTEKNKGWKTLFVGNTDISSSESKEQEQKLPSLQENEAVQADVSIKEGKTKPPKPYTEGQLINAMKTIGKYIDDDEEIAILKSTEGIGTEATRSGIIEQIKKRQYIEVKKNIVHVTKKGEILCNAIEGTLLSSPSMTAKWESFLSEIGQGGKTQQQFLNRIQQFINKMIGEMPQAIGGKKVITDTIDEQQQVTVVATCPSCGKGIVDKGKFYGCSGYKDGCKVTFPKKLAGKTLSKTAIKTLCEKKETNKLKGFKSSKTKKSFDAALKLDNNYNIKFNF